MRANWNSPGFSSRSRKDKCRRKCTCSSKSRSSSASASGGLPEGRTLKSVSSSGQPPEIWHASPVHVLFTSWAQEVLRSAASIVPSPRRRCRADTSRARPACRIGRACRVIGSGRTRSACQLKRTGLQPREPLAAAGAPEADRHLVTDQSPAAPCQDGWPAGETRALLLAAAGGESLDPTPVRGDASEDLGATGSGTLTRGECKDAGLATRGHKRGAVGVQGMPWKHVPPTRCTSARAE